MVSKAYAKSFADHSFGNLRSIYQQRDNKVLQMLADILGHTNLSTTRIYTAESGAVHVRQIEHLNLIVT